MSVKIHPREQGATIRCNGESCVSRFTTGQVRSKDIRAGAKSAGWIRGLWKPATAERGANTRHDICPSCAPAEKKAAADRKTAADARRKKRDADRRAVKKAMPTKEAA